MSGSPANTPRKRWRSASSCRLVPGSVTAAKLAPSPHEREEVREQRVRLDRAPGLGGHQEQRAPRVDRVLHGGDRAGVGGVEHRQAGPVRPRREGPAQHLGSQRGASHPEHDGVLDPVGGDPGGELLELLALGRACARRSSASRGGWPPRAFPPGPRWWRRRGAGGPGSPAQPAARRAPGRPSAADPGCSQSRSAAPGSRLDRSRRRAGGAACAGRRPPRHAAEALRRGCATSCRERCPSRPTSPARWQRSPRSAVGSRSATPSWADVLKGRDFVISSRRLWLLSMALYHGGHPLLARWVKNFNSMLYHNSLPCEVLASPDVRLGHHGIGTVLHPKVVIGAGREDLPERHDGGSPDDRAERDRDRGRGGGGRQLGDHDPAAPEHPHRPGGTGGRGRRDHPRRPAEDDRDQRTCGDPPPA